MEKRKRLLENIFSMVTLRGMEYILAFLLVPYLLRTLGPARFGSIAFMQGIIAYFTLIINYGFNKSHNREEDYRNLPYVKVLPCKLSFLETLLLRIDSIISYLRLFNAPD